MYLKAGILFFSLLCGLCSQSFARTYTAFVMDCHTGDVYHEHKADNIVYPASLTKMMTLLMIFDALESGKLKFHQKLKISKKASRQPPTKLGLKSGGYVTVKDAIYGLMVKSANDAAVVVAEALAGSEAKFAAQMTRKARKLGLRNTTFKNASGLPNKHQKTTAREMAKLSRILINKYPRYYKYFSTRVFKYKGRSFRNHNKLLTRVKGCDGIKTGYINASGWNLAASAVQNGHRLIAVVIGGKTRQWRDRQVAKLLNAGFKNVRSHQRHTPMPRLKPLMIAPPKKPKTGFRTISPATKTGTWAIQVGAFKAKNQAQTLAQSARSLLPILKKAQVLVSPSPKKKMYRARLIGLDENMAKKACTHLSKSGLDCLAMNLK
ncbi:MAG: serine hydrolase [Alphaproteobacteria bacterium]